MSTKLNGSKYCYVSLKIQLNISYLFALSFDGQSLIICLHIIKWLNSSISNNSIYMSSSSIWPIDRCYFSRPKWTREQWQWRGTHIPQSSKAGASPSDCLISYPGHSLGGLIHIYQPSARAGYDTRSIFKRSLAGLNSEFSFSLTSCLTKAEEPSLPNYLPIAEGRIIGFIPFLSFCRDAVGVFYSPSRLGCQDGWACR